MARSPKKSEVVTETEVNATVTTPERASPFRRVRHVRCKEVSEIAALGASLDAGRNQLDMELRPDLGGVLISRSVNGQPKEYVLPMGNIRHIELLPEAKVVNPEPEEVEEE